jgi:hypothetical protein
MLWLVTRFEAAAIFAHRMGDDPRLLLVHVKDADPTVRGAISAVVLDSELARVSGRNPSPESNG